MAANSESKLDRRFIQTVQLLNIYLNHFPSHERHGLALKIRMTAYEMYDYIVEAQKRYHKKGGPARQLRLFYISLGACIKNPLTTTLTKLCEEA